MSRRLQVAVVGAGRCAAATAAVAEAVGRELGDRGVCLVCGGRGGVMDAACRGVRAAGGIAVGILPGEDAAASPPNPSLDAVVFTGAGQARNLAVVLSAAAVIAVGGGWGTLSEIALAAKHGIPVVLLDSWGLEPPGGAPEPVLQRARDPAEAVRLALAAADRKRLGLAP